MKILNVNQLKECDQFTIKNKPIFSINLMEKAAKVSCEWILKNSDVNEDFIIFCGNGNNGGDGLALARLLSTFNRKVKVVVNYGKKFSKDAVTNLQRIPENVPIIDASDFSTNIVRQSTVIIDAIFGIGLNKNIGQPWEAIINEINTLSNQIIALDMPSGLSPDGDRNSDVFIKANDTISFQFYKKIFFHPETGVYCGKIHVLNVDLSPIYIKEVKVDSFVADEREIKNIYKKRPEFSHKGNFGKAVLVGGSYGKTGAIVLAGRVAARTGAGLTYINAPECAYSACLLQIPEAMFEFGGNREVEQINTVENADYGIGPGFGKSDIARSALENFLRNHSKPIVLDADALMLLSSHFNLLSWVPKDSILTPHPKEFDRLFGASLNSFDRLELAKEMAKKYGVNIVLKDHHSQIILSTGEVYYNVTGNSGLAKGGSGDVLTGIITSLLAQKYSPKEAAIFGVWIHGKAADLALKGQSKESLLASDVIESVGKVFNYLSK
ncbi:NAD(P)H-hydrate dehydratase [Soonwooa sp.]|uniref:NAD(P)H-hydrate dehydratase n=1 Tax=Soonwooa sp. TaxID=1938592 RepID=UPI0026066AA9|nr:NAD(P)H-hydrate dehydratase [Soonwooa sp.]